MAKRRISSTDPGSVPLPPATETGARDEHASPVRHLLVQPQRGKPVSRLQRTFNRLVEEAAALEARVETQREDLEVLLARYRDRVEKLDRDCALAQLALARALAEAQARVGLRGNQREDLAATICSLCEDAFLSVAPDADTEALYDDWSERSFREQLAAAAARRRGREGDADPDDEGGGHDASGEAGSSSSRARRDQAGASTKRRPEADGRVDRDDHSREDADEDGAADAHAPGRGPRRGAHRTADFLAREARRREQEALARRSVREVYLSLARVLHPDTVLDAAGRPEREDAMKRATAAYRDGDLLALLRLELRWLRDSREGRETPGDATLRAWIRALREQVEKLQDAVALQCADPRFDAIAGLAFLPRKKALAEIEVRAKELRAATAELLDLRAVVHGCESKRELAAFVRGARHDRFR